MAELLIVRRDDRERYALAFNRASELSGEYTFRLIARPSQHYRAQNTILGILTELRRLDRRPAISPPRVVH